MQHIAKWITKTMGQGLAFAKVCALVGFAAVALSGCVGGGMDFASGVDRTVKTGSIPGAGAIAAASISDEVTVRNAVSSADLSRIETHPIPWANANSGSAGVIGSIAEDRLNGLTCRTFTTTRHSYEGIAKFDGKTCQAGAGEWYLTRFERQS